MNGFIAVILISYEDFLKLGTINIMLSISVVHFQLLLHHLPDFLIIGAFLEIFCRLKINGAVYVR